MITPDGWEQALILFQGRCQTSTISLNTSEDWMRGENSVPAGTLLAGFPPEALRPAHTPEDEEWSRQFVEAVGACALLVAEPVQ
jgi:hypothetical protein